MRLTIDSYAWIEQIAGTRTGAAARAKMEAATECFVPAIVLAEVAAKLNLNRWSDADILAELQAMTEAAELVQITPPLAVAAAHAAGELRARAAAARGSRPGLGDGLVLASARSTESRVLTGDPHFVGLTETEWVGP